MLCVENGRDTGCPCEVNVATLGVTLADLLWGALVERHDWSSELQRRFDEHQSCLRRSRQQSSQGGSGSGDLSFPLLSVRSAVRVVAGPGWHAMSQAPLDDDWKLSPSQLFFMLLFMTRACFSSPGRTEEDDDYSASSMPAHLVRRMADFNAAFRCGPVPVFDIGHCL
ncbi:hypothetical protein MTO96_043436 [Rhipicephalus appendiculatus]